MATSGSRDYNDTRTTIITDALVLLGVVGAEQAIHESDSALANRFLNRLVKSWDAQGIHLWTYTEATIFLEKGTNKYLLDNQSSSAKWSNTVVETTLSAAEASGQTVISVTSSTGMTAADIVGIVLNDNTTHWSTIASVDSSTQITIDDATTGAAASGNNVYTFTSRANRPQRIHSIRRVTDSAANNEVPLIKLSREEYFDLPSKNVQGVPSQFYYDPQLTTGALYLWQTPEDTSTRLRITYMRQIEDFDAAGNNPDLPQEWLECLVYNLAAALAPVFGKEQKALGYITPRAEHLLFSISTYDVESTSIQLVPGDIYS